MYCWIPTNNAGFIKFFLPLNRIHNSLITFYVSAYVTPSLVKINVLYHDYMYILYIIFFKGKVTPCAKMSDIIVEQSTYKVVYLLRKSGIYGNKTLFGVAGHFLPSFCTWVPSCGFVNHCIFFFFFFFLLFFFFW